MGRRIKRRSGASKTTASKDVYSQRRKKLVKYGAGGAVVGGAGYGLMKGLGGGSDSSGSGSGGSGTGSGGNGSGSGSDSEDGGSGGSGSGSGGDSNVKSKVVEYPIDNYDEALDFANREWNKIKREDGRSLECQVLGGCSWKVGEWCKVYLPSFDVDGFMYITKTSQSSDEGEWSTNLTLVDYPPGWGKEELEKDSEDDSEDDSGEDSGDGSGEGSGDGNSDGTGSDGNSNGGEGASDTTNIDGTDFYN